MEKINIGVIGVGHLGEKHAQTLAKISRANLVGVCDINKTKGQEVSRNLNTPYFQDYQDLLSQAEAVVIAVPTRDHFKIARDSLNKGAHIMVEKPITSKLADADSLIKLAKKKKRILQVGHIERFNNAFKAICDIAKEPKFIEVHRLSPFPARSLDIGVVSDLMIHDIDLILGLVQSDIVYIDAVGVNVLTNLEDIASVRLRFKNGCIANLTASRISDESMRKFRIFLKNAYISVDYKNNRAIIYTKENQNILKKEIPIEITPPLQSELESFLDCVETGKKPVVSGEEARLALNVAIDIQKKINNYIKTNA